MDGGSTRTAVLELINACRRILEIMSGFNDVDNAMKMFINDIQELSHELKYFGEELSITGEEWKGGHWVKQSIYDCQGALTRLEQILDDSKNVEVTGESSTWRAADVDSREIALLHREFTAYRWMIQLCRLLIVASSRRNEDRDIVVSKGLEELTLAICSLLRLIPRRNDVGPDSQLANDLDSWTCHAEKLVSSSTYVYSRCISEDHTVLREVEEYISVHKARLNNSGTVNGSVKNISFPDDQNDDTRCAYTQVTNQISSLDIDDSRTPDISFVGPDNDFDVIQKLRGLASERFAAKDYPTAELILQKILNTSEGKYGTQFGWRDETMEMLAAACWELGKWEEADKVFDQQFKGRAKLMGTLARGSFEHGKRNSADRLLSKHFEGREPIMESFVEIYLREKNWKEAKRLLVELLQYEPDQAVRLQRMHTLANICFIQKDFGEAQAWCLKAVIGSQTTLGEQDDQFYDAITLLARIYNAQGDLVQNEAYEAVLEDLSPGLHECVEVEQLTYLLSDSRHSKEAIDQIGKTFFKHLFSESTKRLHAVRENIRKNKSQIIGSGRGWTLIHEFAAHGLELAVQLLLKKGMNIEATCDAGTTLIVAAKHGYPAIVKLLLDIGSNTEARNKEGSTALNAAVLKGSERCVQLLLDRGANVEAKERGQTPLIVAAIHGYESIVRLLLDKGANIEVESKMGTALIEATWGDCVGVVKLLLERGATIDTNSPKHGSALTIAAMNGYEEIVRLLLEHGANMESKNKYGQTPLMLAAKNEKTDVIKLLLSKGADIKAKDFYGSTALTLANRAPASKATTLAQMTELHMTETVALLLKEIQRR